MRAALEKAPKTRWMIGMIGVTALASHQAPTKACLSAVGWVLHVLQLGMGTACARAPHTFQGSAKLFRLKRSRPVNL